MHNDNVEAPEIINNLDWYENMKFTDFFPNYGKHYRLSKMLAKESVKKRLEDVHRKSELEIETVVSAGHTGIAIYFIDVTFDTRNYGSPSPL